MQTAQLITEAFPYYSDGLPSAAAFAISAADAFLLCAQPCAAELLAAVLAIVRTEPSSAVDLSYRRYVWTVLAPRLRRVATVLKAHGATIEVSASRRPRPANSSGPC